MHFIVAIGIVYVLFMFLGTWGLLVGILVASSYLSFVPMRKLSTARQRTSSLFRGNGRSSKSAQDRVTITEMGFISFFQIAGYVSKADGLVSNQEIRQTTDFMQRLSLTPDQRQVAIEGFKEGKSPGFDINRCLEKLRSSSGMGQFARELLFEAMVNLSAIDRITQEKETVLLAYASALNISNMRAQSYISTHQTSYWRDSTSSSRSSYRSSDSGSYSRSGSNRGSGIGKEQTNKELSDAYITLGVNPKDSNDSIKRAYKKLIAETHPDKFMGKDLPPFLIEAANEKASEVNKAWDTIKKARAIS